MVPGIRPRTVLPLPLRRALPPAGAEPQESQLAPNIRNRFGRQTTTVSIGPAGVETSVKFGLLFEWHSAYLLPGCPACRHSNGFIGI